MIAVPFSVLIEASLFWDFGPNILLQNVASFSAGLRMQDYGYYPTFKSSAYLYTPPRFRALYLMDLDPRYNSSPIHLSFR